MASWAWVLLAAVAPSLERYATHGCACGAPCPRDAQLRGDLFEFVSSHLEMQAGAKRKGKALTGRAAARVMHGLQSPAFPWKEWHGHRCWGQHKATDFERVRELAEECIETARRRQLAAAQRGARRAR